MNTQKRFVTKKKKGFATKVSFKGYLKIIPMFFISLNGNIF